VREFISIVAGTAVGLAWLAIWACVLGAFGIALFQRKAQDRASRRERIKDMGKMWYILVCGVLGFGLAFGLALFAVDFFGRRDSFGWTSEIARLVFMTLLFGWFQGARTWSETFRDPVPFPPNYPPTK